MCAITVWEELCAGRVVAPLDGDGLVAALLHHVVGEALEELGVLALVHGAQHAGRRPASRVHWEKNMNICLKCIVTGPIMKLADR